MGGLSISVVVKGKLRFDLGPSGAPVIDVFLADPVGGGCFKMVWSLHGATRADLITNPGTPQEGKQGVVGEAGMVICPQGETVYRIQATNDSGVAWKEIVLP